MSQVLGSLFIRGSINHRIRLSDLVNACHSIGMRCTVCADYVYCHGNGILIWGPIRCEEKSEKVLAQYEGDKVDSDLPLLLDKVVTFIRKAMFNDISPLDISDLYKTIRILRRDYDIDIGEVFGLMHHVAWAYYYGATIYVRYDRDNRRVMVIAGYNEPIVPYPHFILTVDVNNMEHSDMVLTRFRKLCNMLNIRDTEINLVRSM